MRTHVYMHGASWRVQFCIYSPSKHPLLLDVHKQQELEQVFLL